MMMGIIICSTLSSYSWPLKGASILNMLQRVLGEEMMRHGLTLYLEQHKYGNANTDDLWQSLSAASLNSSHPVDVKVSSSKLVNWLMIKLWALIYLIDFYYRSKVIMDSWTKQLGYPLVTLRRHGNLIHASQKHFLLVNSTFAAASQQQQQQSGNSSHKWYVPLSFTTSAAPNVENQIWMHGKDG